MINKDTRIVIENEQSDFLYKKNKSNLNITFNRISFIFFVFFVICLIYVIHLIHLGSRKINNEEIILMHNSLKINTPIKIINPENQKFVETKVYKRSNYPGIFNAVISEKIVTILELDIDNPYVEIIQIKKNKKFIAKKANTFDEEKNVADTAPVESIEMDDLTNNTESNNVLKKKNSYVLVINDFYYIDSAKNLKSELLRKINIKNLYIKKINNKKYRLYVGPFKNFNALKTTYISLNNLGFSDLNIYKE